jgi:hypothetical protein
MSNARPPLTLSEVAIRLRPLGLGHPIQRMDVFGSIARGDATAASDVDLLVTLDPTREVSTAELLDMAGEAEELVGRPVDFVLRQSLDKSSKPEARRHILETAVCIYGS